MGSDSEIENAEISLKSSKLVNTDKEKYSKFEAEKAEPSLKRSIIDVDNLDTTDTTHEPDTTADVDLFDILPSGMMEDVETEFGIKKADYVVLDEVLNDEPFEGGFIKENVQ